MLLMTLCKLLRISLCSHHLFGPYAFALHVYITTCSLSRLVSVKLFKLISLNLFLSKNVEGVCSHSFSLSCYHYISHIPPNPLLLRTTREAG